MLVNVNVMFDKVIFVDIGSLLEFYVICYGEIIFDNGVLKWVLV